MGRKGVPSPFKGKPRPELCGPRPAAVGPRPHVWVSGPDPAVHYQYRQYIQHKNQAQWRGEEYYLTFEEYQDLWRERWHQRGRTKDTYCLTRVDYDLPWCVENCDVITRGDHNRRQLENKGRRADGRF